MFQRRRFRSAQIRKARHQRFIFLFTLWFAVFLSIVLLLVQVSQIPQLRITEITISGSEGTNKFELFDTVLEKISGKYLFLFSRSNIVVFPRATIKEALFESYPRLETIEIDVLNLGQIEINVTERDAVGIVCSPSSYDITLAEICLFVDDRGFVFDNAPTFSGNVFFEYREDSKRRFQIGSYYIQSTAFVQLHDLRNALEEVGLSPKSLTASSKNIDKFTQHFTFTLKEGTNIIFSSDFNDLEKEFQNLQTIISSDEFKEESSGDIGAIEYIDLRFGNKIFYRLKSGVDLE